MYHVPRGEGFFITWLTFHFWVGKNYIFRVLHRFFSPRRTSARLGGGENLHLEDCCYA